MAIFLIILVFFYLFHPTTKFSSGHASESQEAVFAGHRPYNNTYPLTQALLHGGQPTFRIAIIADMDTSSKSKTSGNTWVSYLKMGHLSHNRGSGAVEVTWDAAEPVELSSHFALKGE